MKVRQYFLKISLAALAAMSLSLLTSCKGTLNNENDWAFRKGSSPEYVPLQVSKKVYR
jgi:hypothetical protein